MHCFTHFAFLIIENSFLLIRSNLFALTLKYPLLEYTKMLVCSFCSPYHFILNAGFIIICFLVFYGRVVFSSVFCFLLISNTCCVVIIMFSTLFSLLSYQFFSNKALPIARSLSLFLSLHMIVTSHIPVSRLKRILSG